MNVHASIRDLPAELTGTHLWDCNLDEGFGKFDASIAAATHVEQRVAAALGSDLLRDRHLRDCRLRRHILSHCLGLAPKDLNFIHDPKGRARVLADGVTVPGQLAKFSVATTGPAWLLGVSFDGEIGAALELDDATFDATKVAQEFFNAEENQWLASLLPLQQRAMFLRCWALKEAYAKAVGLNLKLDLREVHVAALED
ncbi:MAG: 4'-phosphopantetheinyl transferase superfamily protein, partial [Verrucomicrobia bacterium]|nr:4'-phosphopantetheinyl transferase superfamily protein [Verrucomicrobiota bacterium]